jgi:hypothetical protein
MPLRRSLWLAFLIVCASPCTGFGQAAEPGKAPDSATVIILQNPTLTALNRIAPDRAAAFAFKIGSWGNGRQQDSLRGDDATPTPSERAEIEANPDFKLAFKHYPLATLTLLRSANEILRKARDADD